MPYIEQLLDAYGERERCTFADYVSVMDHAAHGQHIRRQRERFFDADTFPHVLLRGDGGEHTEGCCWTVHGDLTIRDTAHDASLAVAVRGMMLDRSGRAKAALTVTTAIHRSDYGLTTELRQESGDSGEADVHIAADVEAFLRE